MIGPQGSGKTTQAKLVSEKLGIAFIDVGDIFREIAKQDTPLGRKIKYHVEGGELAPDDLTIQIVKDRLSKPGCKNGFLIDDFPKTLQQAEMLDEFANIDTVIELQLDDKTAVERLTKRRQCTECGHITSSAEQTCPQCGGKLIQRVDDVPEKIKLRLQIYRDVTEPLVEYYRPRDIVRTVDASQPVEKISADIMQALGAAE